MVLNKIKKKIKTERERRSGKPFKEVYAMLTDLEYEDFIRVMHLSGSRTKAECLRRSIRAYKAQLENEDKKRG